MLRDYWKGKDGGILAIPARIESELGQAIVQCGREARDGSAGGGNVQILESMVRLGREQVITVEKAGMGRINQGLD